MSARGVTLGCRCQPPGSGLCPLRRGEKLLSNAFSRALPGRYLVSILPAIALLAVPMEARADAEPSTLEVSQAARLALGIETAAVRRNADHDGVVLTGHVVVPTDSRRAVVSAAAMTVVDTLALPGQSVSAGDPVQRVHSPELAALHAQLDVLQLEAEHTRELAERAEALLQAGLTTGEDVHERRLASIAARLELAALQSRFGGLQAESDPASFLILAPADGRIADIRTEAGNRLAEGDVIVSVTTGHVLWARVYVPPAISSSLTLLDPVRVSGLEDEGRIEAIGSQVDPVRRAVEVRVSLPETYFARPGSLVDLVFSGHGDDRLLALPARALVRIGGQESVFVERGDGFERVNVRVVSRTRDTAAIAPNGLSDGDQVAVSGLAALKNMAEGG